MAIELRKGTIFLDGTDGARIAGLRVKLGRLLDGKGILVVRRTVAAVRVRSWLFAAHRVMIPQYSVTSRRLSPICEFGRGSRHEYRMNKRCYVRTGKGGGESVGKDGVVVWGNANWWG